MTAPKFLDLEWNGLKAHPTSMFWEFWRAADRALTKAGIRVVVNGPDHVVSYDPSVETPEGLHLLQRLTDCSYLAPSQRREALEEEIAAQFRDRAAERQRALVQSTQRKGQELLEKWGMAVVQRVKMTALVAAPDLTRMQLKELEQCIRETERRNVDRIREAQHREKPAVDWPEETVVAAVRFMTSLDDDHAELDNSRGWGAGDSSWGHWCVAMFGTDNHAVAVRIGRQICANYVETQLKGFVPQQVA